MSISYYDWIVIGEGISSEFFLYWLNKKTKKKLNVLQLSSSLYPSATMRGTGLIVPFGINNGIGKLGALIVESRQFMIDFCLENYKEVIEPLNVIHYSLSGDEDFKRRYGKYSLKDDLVFTSEQGYFLNWTSLKEVLRKELHHLNITRKTEHVLSILKNSELTVKTSENEYQSRSCFNGAGYGHKDLETVTANETLAAGDSLVWKNKEVLKKGNLVTFQNYNAFQCSKGFIFGSTTDERAHMYAPNWQMINCAYELFQRTFLNITFPAIKEARVSSGIRHKMSKHRPVYGFQNNIAYIAGLHKNGYIFANFLAKKLVNELLP